ncbi:hypothetical protein MTR64_18890, partial [Novosphingobium sp. 2580]|nr:hypothetical protein [Novosphingobium album (ex Hu et al. 2023)]
MRGGRRWAPDPGENVEELTLRPEGPGPARRAMGARRAGLVSGYSMYQPWLAISDWPVSAFVWNAAKN